MDMEEENISELDPDTWDVASSDKVSPYFTRFIETRLYNGKSQYFGRTKFHDYLTNILKNEIEDTVPVDENYPFVGIQGIGKSSTIVYYVLSCIKNGNHRVHYVDMNLVEDEEEICKLKEYMATMQKGDTLILDHVTVFNGGIVHKIKKAHIVSKILMIETGFSASARRHEAEYLFDRKWQLSRREFRTIWIECLKKMKYSLKDQETFINDLYDYNSRNDNFILTPRLLQRVRSYMTRGENHYDPTWKHGKGLEYFTERYMQSLISDITKFKLKYKRAVHSEEMSDEKQLCCEFSLHTIMLLHQMKENRETIMTVAQKKLYKVAINMLNSEYGQVTDNDLEKDARFAEIGLQKGDMYVKITHLIPELANHWREVFPFKIDDIIDNKFGIDVSSLLKICFESGGIRKEFEDELVNLQFHQNFLIRPWEVQKSHCKINQGPSCKFTLPQCNAIHVPTIKKLFYLQPSLSDLEDITVGAEYQGHDKNVAKMACYIQKELMRNRGNSGTSLLVYPAISNFKGIDYIMYTESHNTSHETPKRQKTSKNPYALYLIQVATRATHTGVTIGEALNVFKKIIKDETIHVVIFIARKERDKYTLSGNMSFENVSAINLTNLCLRGYLQKSKLLFEVVKMIEQSQVEKSA